MIDLGEEIYEILDEYDWRICGWGERIGRGYYYELEHCSGLGEDVIETVECIDDSKEAFINGVENLCFDFDPEEHAAGWIGSRGEFGVPESIQALLDDANEIKDSLDDLRIALKDIDLNAEEVANQN